MTVDAALTLVVLIMTAVMLVLDRVPSVLVLAGAVVALVLLGVADSEIALSGLSSPAPATIAALYVLAGAATATGAVGPFVDRLLNRRGALLPLTAGTAALSSIVPNTPLVAMFAPRVVRWSQRNGVSVSRYLMPLSFASLLGGVVTVIGTSTNLVVSDLLAESGVEPLGVFDITMVGLPVAVVGVIVLSSVSARLLPERVPVVSESERTAREFQMAAEIDAGGPLVGRSIAQSGLRALDGIYLALIERRGGAHDRPVAITASSETLLEARDVCCFVGDVRRVLDLHEMSGLTSLEHAHVLATEGVGTEVFEAVVSPGSSLVGSTLQDVDFRRRYGGAVLAIHRADESLPGQLGRIPLRGGDVLLLLAPSTFAANSRGDADFSLVAAVDEPPPVRPRRAWIVLVAALAMIVLAASGAMTLLEAAVVAAVAVVAGGVIDAREGWRSVNLHVILTMAIAISLGRIVAASGLADDIASLVESVDGFGLGDVGLVVTMMLATIVLTELLTNTAAAALMVPVGLSLAAKSGVDPTMMAVTVLIGASCSFLTPIGYQTNLMVFGLGGYRFSDFARVGAPLTVSTLVTSAVVIPLAFG